MIPPGERITINKVIADARLRTFWDGTAQRLSITAKALLDITANLDDFGLASLGAQQLRATLRRQECKEHLLPHRRACFAMEVLCPVLRLAGLVLSDAAWEARW